MPRACNQRIQEMKKMKMSEKKDFQQLFTETCIVQTLDVYTYVFILFMPSASFRFRQKSTQYFFVVWCRFLCRIEVIFHSLSLCLFHSTNFSSSCNCNCYVSLQFSVFHMNIFFLSAPKYAASLKFIRLVTFLRQDLFASSLQFYTIILLIGPFEVLPVVNG